MMESETDLIVELRKAYRPAMFISLAVLGSLVAYLIVALLLSAGRGVHPALIRGNTAYAVRLGCYGFAILQVILVRIMRGVFYRRAPGLDARALARRLMLVSIFTSVFSEVPGLLGLVLFLLTGRTWDLYVLAFVSLVLVFMFFPRFRYWEDWAREQIRLSVK
jgi:hypothetical protein